MEQFTENQIEGLKASFSKLNTVDPDRLPEFHAMFDKMNEATLKQVANAGIKFLSKLAANESIRRGVSLV
jgi:hypothetical protein